MIDRQNRQLTCEERDVLVRRREFPEQHGEEVLSGEPVEVLRALVVHDHLVFLFILDMAGVPQHLNINININININTGHTR